MFIIEKTTRMNRKMEKYQLFFSASQHLFLRFHYNFRAFIVNGKQLLRNENNNWDVKIITEKKKKLLTRGGVYILRDFQKGHNQTKN